MNVLFLFATMPQLSNNGGLYNDIVIEFTKHGHKVFAASIGETDYPRVTEEYGATVLRVPGRKTTSLTGIKKALNYQKIAYLFMRYIPQFFNNVRFDWIISNTIPPEIGVVSWWLKRKYRCKHLLIISDFLWQDGVSLGVFNKFSPVCLYYKFVEKVMFKMADMYAAPSQATLDFSSLYYKSFFKKPSFILKWWENIKKVPSNNDEIRKRFGLSNKFVIIYGGSVGLMQKGDYLIELAKSVSDIDNILFILLGRGDYLENVRKKCASNEISNILFQDFLPQEEYYQLLSVCDVGLIILNEDVGSPNIPSKIVSYYCYGVPVLASVDPITDLDDVLEHDQTGFSALSGHNNDLRAKLLEMYNNPELLIKMSSNAKIIYEGQMTSLCAYKTIVSNIESFN